MRALPLLLLLSPALHGAAPLPFPPPAISVRDDADEQARFIAGLFADGQHEMVVKEARRFLKEFKNDARRNLVRYRLASSLFELGTAEQAIPHYRALSEHRGFEYQAEAQLRLGQCELLAGNAQKARAALEQALAGSQDYLKPSASFFLAEAQFQLHDYKAAAHHYAKSLKSEQSATYHAHAQRGLAWCAFRQKQWDPCRNAATLFLREHAGHELEPEVRFLLGDADFEAGDMNSAAKVWKEVPGGPWQAAALRGLAWVRSRHGDDEGAAALFARLLELEPEGRFAPEAALQNGVHLLRAGHASEALAVLRQPIAGESAEVLYWQAQASSAAGDTERALQLLDAAIRGAQGELQRRIAAARGDLLFDLGRLDESAQAYGEDASDYGLHAGATASLNSGQAERALELANRFLTEYPQSTYTTSTSIVRAEALFMLQDYKTASQAFGELQAGGQLDAQQAPGVHSRLAWCQFLLGDLDRAARTFGELCQTHPASDEAIEARYMQGRACSESGQAQAAVEAWERYVADHPGAPRRAEAQLQLARLTGGAGPLRQLLAESPDHELAASAWIELAEHEAGVGRSEEAIATYQEYLKRFPGDSAVAQARYALAWELRSNGKALDAKEQLRELLAAGAPEGLLLSSLELAVWCASDLQAAPECENIWKAFAGRCKDPARQLAVAKVAARCLQEAGEGARARAVLASTEGRIQQPDLQLELAIERIWCAMETDATQEAQSLTRAALKSAPGDARVLEAAFFAGEACFEAGEFGRAVEFYSPAGAQQNGELADEALYKLGFSQLSLKRNEAAARSFERLVDDHGKSPLAAESLYLAGEARFRAGDMRACCVRLARFRDRHKRHAVRPKALHRLGLAANELGDSRLANDALTELLSTTPDFELRIEARYEQGLALIQLKRQRAARAALDAVLAEARKSKGDSLYAARARLALADLDTQAGDLDSALSHYLKVALLYEEGEEVRDATLGAARTLEAQGERELAIKKYRELKTKAPKSPQGQAAAARLAALNAI